MKKLIQTRLHTSMKKEERGNCFPTVIACIMDMNSPEDVIQIQEYYKEEREDDNWVVILTQWLTDKGYEWGSLNGHQSDGSYYLVTGKTKRGVVHICIYKDGKLYHDPHPSGKGLETIMHYEYLIALTDES